VTKLLTTLVYVMLLASFGKYDTISVLSFIFFPVYLSVAGRIPVKPLLKRLLYVEPMIIAIGLLNPLFDHSRITILGRELSAGWLISVSLIMKGTLAVTAALLLIATTGMEGISLSMRKLRVPKVFVMQMMMTYRYLSVLMEETARTIQAYSLRALGHKAIDKHIWGPLLGQILLRTMDRAQRIYEAMCLRGFSGEYRIGTSGTFQTGEILFVLFWSGYFVIARQINIPILLGNILTGAK
jgi:cobalt/nickel transport system permease protein